MRSGGHNLPYPFAPKMPCLKARKFNQKGEHLFAAFR
jgi:hypothetical protein